MEKNYFAFPIFEDMQLGPIGDEDGCGCLVNKSWEVAGNAIDAGFARCGQSDVVLKIRSSILGDIGTRRYWDLCSPCNQNTLTDRKDAYAALERATEIVFNVTISKKAVL